MSFWTEIGHWFVGIGKAFGGALKISTEAFLKDFAKDKLGKLAVDAVKAIQAGELHDVAARDAAIAQFKIDAKAAGVEVETFAESQLNWLIETALQVVLAKLA